MGDEELLLYRYDSESKVIEKKCHIFKREKFYKILQIETQDNLIFLLTESNSLEVIKIMNFIEIKKSYKRKEK